MFHLCVQAIAVSGSGKITSIESFSIVLNCIEYSDRYRRPSERLEINPMTGLIAPGKTEAKHIVLSHITCSCCDARSSSWNLDAVILPDTSPVRVVDLASLALPLIHPRPNLRYKRRSHCRYPLSRSQPYIRSNYVQDLLDIYCGRMMSSVSRHINLIADQSRQRQVDEARYFIVTIYIIVAILLSQRNIISMTQS